MPVLRRVGLRYALLVLWAVACERSQPLEPAIQASSASGPKVTAPSNTNAVAASQSGIDVSWRDNSSNETGFEVHRSTAGASSAFALLTSTGAGVTSYSDAGLAASTQYCYQVRSFRAYDGKTSYSAFSAAACATTPAPPPPPPPPAAPWGTRTVPNNSSTVTITWTDNSANEGGFRIERTLDGGASWATVSTTAANVTSSQDGGRSSEQQVCYRVFAFNAGGDSPPSNTRCTAPPAAPSDLAAVGVDGPTIHVTWADHSALEGGYAVERSTDGVTFSSLAALSANNTAYHDGAVTTNTTYWYRVRAKKDGGFSDFSNIASGTAGSLIPPVPPVSLGTDNLSYGLSNILLYWRAGSYNQDGFRIERCSGVLCSDADFMLLATLGATSDSYVDIYVQPGSTYTYRVRAFNNAGVSAPSPEATGTACYVGVDEGGFYYCLPPQ